jgi:hypothetical protein
VGTVDPCAAVGRVWVQLSSPMQDSAINQNVVYVDDHKVIKSLSENVIHEGAKCGGCISEPKRHHQEFI